MDSNNGIFKVGTLLTAVEFITAISALLIPITTLGGGNTAPVATHPLAIYDNTKKTLRNGQLISLYKSSTGQLPVQNLLSLYIIHVSATHNSSVIIDLGSSDALLWIASLAKSITER